MSEHFEAALGDLQAALPTLYKATDPTSEVYKVLQVLAENMDELAAFFEAIFADQALATATHDGLLREWAPLYGAGHEQLPLDTEELRSYLQARAREDGSKASLIATLLTLLQSPDNAGVPDLGGLHFPADGTGLHFPADGTGLHFVSGKLEVIERPTDFTFTVNVKQTLTFDRAAFARAVNRFRLADELPPTITEVP